MWRDNFADVLLILAIFYPIIAFFVFVGTVHYDMEVWLQTGKIALEKGMLNVYSIESKMPDKFSGGYFNYPLPWLVIITSVYYFTMNFSYANFQFVYFLKLILLAFFESSIIVLHSYLLKKVGRLRASLAVVTFSIIPGLMNSIVPLLWGHMDSIPAFFTILSIYFFENRRYDSSAFSLGLAIATKYYPLIMLPSYLILIYKSKGISGDILRYLAIALLPVILVSIPPLINDPAAYIGAHTFYKDWVGDITLQYWVYYSLGIEHYVWYGNRNVVVNIETIPNLKYIPLISYASIILTSAMLLISYIAILRTKRGGIQNYVALLLPLLALMGYWKFVHENFIVWALPFVIMDLWIAKKISSLLWLFSTFLIGMVWLRFVFALDWLDFIVFNYHGINLAFFLVPCISIIYHIELLIRVGSKKI
jgi:uncharacterized membrane protein